MSKEALISPRSTSNYKTNFVSPDGTHRPWGPPRRLLNGYRER